MYPLKISICTLTGKVLLSDLFFKVGISQTKTNTVLKSIFNGAN